MRQNLVFTVGMFWSQSTINSLESSTLHTATGCGQLMSHCHQSRIHKVCANHVASWEQTEHSLTTATIASWQLSIVSWLCSTRTNKTSCSRHGHSHRHSLSSLCHGKKHGHADPTAQMVQQPCEALRSKQFSCLNHCQSVPINTLLYCFLALKSCRQYLTENEGYFNLSVQHDCPVLFFLVLCVHFCTIVGGNKWTLLWTTSNSGEPLKIPCWLCAGQPPFLSLTLNNGVVCLAQYN